ncbi:hypothetical protein CVT26_013169 [Gymnopilus dilepis]|uniref:BUB1 N-terminal domain-containing protein n=1 Tax=Gymnopilus dilepis TaxID=231916 RepID=A0A409YFM6_9AGAR|nr:hypothetical protein CVT26_013169 [Gymnopilus dilepis]
MLTPQDESLGAPAVVDCDLLEAAKENVQPLGTGRRVTALSAMLATPHAQREAKLSATRNRLRINVELAMDDEEGDPLEAYCRLVYWTLDNYPQGHSAESGLVELLEEATRILKDDRGGKWRNDIKYLKLWLLYASYVEKPNVIYKFLIANDIGTEFALLYEEHAAVLERDGRRREADETYALGIARKASPLEHLETRYAEFQKRMMAHIYAPVPAPSEPRKALAVVSGSAGTASLASLPQPRAVSSSTSRVPTSSSKSRFQVFVDLTGSESSEGATTNEWNDAGTRKSRIKENRPEVKPMAGAKLKQPGRSKRIAASSGSGAAESKSKIVVFRDPEPEAKPSTPAPAVKKGGEASSSKTPARAFKPFVDQVKTQSSAAVVPVTPRFIPFRDESAVASPPAPVVPLSDSIMKLKKADSKGASGPTTEAEALRKDPLKNYSAEIVAALISEGD